MTGVTPDSLRLSWTVARGPFDSFVILYKDAQGQPQSVPIQGDENEVTVPGLESNRKYKMNLYGLRGRQRVGPVSVVAKTGESEPHTLPSRLAPSLNTGPAPAPAFPFCGGLCLLPPGQSFCPHIPGPSSSDCFQVHFPHLTVEPLYCDTPSPDALFFSHGLLQLVLNSEPDSVSGISASHPCTLTKAAALCKGSKRRGVSSQPLHPHGDRAPLDLIPIAPVRLAPGLIYPGSPCTRPVAFCRTSTATKQNVYLGGNWLALGAGFMTRYP